MYELGKSSLSLGAKESILVPAVSSKHVGTSQVPSVYDDRHQVGQRAKSRVYLVYGLRKHVQQHK